MSDTDIDTRHAGTQDLVMQDGPALPMPASVKDGEKIVDAEFKAHRSRVDAARKALAQAEKTYTSNVQTAQRDREAAAKPKHMASIGMVRKVVLTETTIRTPK